MPEAVIVDCLRTPVGKAPRGALRYTRPDDLAALVINALLARYPQAREEVEDVIMGCAMPEGEAGNNLARGALLRAGLPDSVPGMTINRFCSSGLQAIAIAAERIRAGAAHAIIAGGAESMSMTARGGLNSAPNPWFVDHWPDYYLTMGLTAERLQRRYGVTRAEADEFALASHRKAVAARDAGRFDDEIVPVEAVNVTLEEDEGPRADTTLESLAQLQPVFRAQGTVTAGNSSQASDGAAAALVMSETRARELGFTPKARFVCFAAAGVPPDIMGVGPVVAIPKALALAGLTTDDIDVIEINEAFAVQALTVIKLAHLDAARINPNGGAVALGHPLGATGAKLTATLLRELDRREGRYGMVTMCVGGGQGAAGIFERW